MLVYTYQKSTRSDTLVKEIPEIVEDIAKRVEERWEEIE